MIVVPAALVVLCIYIFQGLSISAPAQTQAIEWIKVIPYLIVLGTAVAGVNVMLVLLLGILSTGIIGIITSGTDISTAFFDWFGAMGTGITGMGELIIITLLAGGMLETIRYNGGIDFIISPPDTSRKRQARCRTEYRRTRQHCQPMHRQQYHRHHYHRTDSQGHRPTLSSGPPEDSQYPGHVLLPDTRYHSLRGATIDCRRISGNFSHQHYR